MGVHGLWELLSPVGRRVSVETLAGKRLAIDASIWMIQFMKAMRDEKGEMVRNAHVLGFFRRILKLLFLRTKPVFVFDGGTPTLKRRTVAARRRHRENAQAKIRKTAEKLLLNHLKTKRLEELAEEIKRGKAKGDAKGKKVVSEEVDGGKKATRVLEQENFDAMLAASITAEEEGLAAGASSAGDLCAEEEDDGDEEMIFPVAGGKIDPAVLASLPPSMQLDLLVQMRENVMAENRQKYQKIKKAPTKFSELQIQSYLKTVAFRREIDEVHKCASGRGLEGVQTSRIASESNREFIFSSSFTGDKQMLSSTMVGNGDKVNQASKKPITWDPVKCKLFSNQSKSSTDASVDEMTSGIGHKVESYHDERGQFRVSRVRGLDIHMTRDLQRNLDLMKEYEQEFSREDMCIDPNPKYTKEALEDRRGYPGINGLSNVSIYDEENNTSITEFTSSQEQPSVIGSKSAIEISFPEDDSGIKDTDDDLFLHLVSGSSTSKLCSGSILPYGSAEESDSECVWEEGLADEIVGRQKNDQDKESHFPAAEENCCEDEAVEWEEGISLAPEVVTDCPTEQEKVVSLGILEEEADIQEAIKRSLQGIERQKSLNISSASASLGISMGDRNVVERNQPFGKHCERSPLSSSTSDGHNQLAYSCMENLLQTIDSAGNQSPSSTFRGNNFNQKMSRVEENKKLISSSVVTGSNLRTSQTISDLLPEEGIKGWVTSGEQCSNEKASSGAETVGKLISSTVIDDSIVKTSQVYNAPTEEGTKNQVTWGELCMNSSKQSREAPILEISREDNVHTGTSNIEVETVGNLQHPDLANEHINYSQSSQLNQSSGRRDEGVNSLKTSLRSKMEVNSGLVQGDANESVCNTEGQSFKSTNSTHEELEDHNILPEANFDKEISLLKQERAGLGEEQRRLESIAESVSSEMFAECQELLQMFGLPYIIAPMEAEAQCAYMEMLNLVDGVVTDDSDVFLFGARNVYKNIFDDRKYVETYLMKDIESELGLSREILIRMALLLGSDYTEGISGIGIVNAIEVVRAFPEEDGLRKFREWIESPDPAIFGKLGTPVGSSKRKASKSKKKDGDGMVDNLEACASKETTHETQHSASDIQPIKDIFMNKHRNVSKNWHFSASFPSEAVVTAYISPQVDGSSESFSWGKPDLFLLRKLCWERFGWNNKKADELLLPVIKEYNKHETQLRIEAFYTFNERFAKIRSQRIKKAVKGITGKCSTELMDDPVHEGSGKKKGSIPSESEECKYEGSGSKRKVRANPSPVEECEPESSKGKRSSKTRNSKRPGRQKSVNNDTDSENGVAVPVILNNEKGRVSEGARGRRGRGSGRGRGRGRERWKEENVISESTQSSPSDCNETVEMETHIQVPEAIRRSTRLRKHVKYAEGNVELDDDATDSMEQEPVDQDINIMLGDVNVHTECANDSPHDSFSGDYLQSGGGFCTEETEGDAFQRGASPITFPVKKDCTIMESDASTLDGEHVHSIPMVEDGDSRDYLLSGGGFCNSENDAQADVAQPDPSPTEEGLDDGRKIKEPKHDESAGAKVLYPDNADGESEPDLGLRAMPLLRRKRRKV